MRNCTRCARRVTKDERNSADLCVDCQEYKYYHQEVQVPEYDVADKIIAFEMGDLGDAAVVELFAHLIKTGLVWKLQGAYGRTAKQLIKSEYISPKGEILIGGIDEV